MAIINIMEKIVDSKIATYMSGHDGCNCETCLNDIKCIALNKLPSKYVNTSKGELFSRVDQIMLRQNSVDLDFAVMKAIEIVKANPRCGSNKE
ncbi:MAG: late competence development ComFB family protein [Oscillospiraceae bacterium]|nr:late competence development ComFB family protein [Oscillospiraceae bacterium]